MKISQLTLILGVSLIMCSSLSFAQNKTDNEGKKQGVWEKKDAKNRLVYKGQFKDDYPIDTFYYYDKKGKITNINVYSDKGRITDVTFLYPSGKTKAEGQYIDKKKQGIWKYYSEKGKMITQESYKDDKKDGIEKKWSMNGKDLIEQTTYSKGKKNGEYYRSLYSEGYYTTFYKNDLLDGDYKEFRNNKSVKISGQFSNGKKEGTWNVYDIGGNIIQRLFYKNDQLTGDAIRFNVADGIKEIAQKNIALIRQAGKQTQLYLVSGEKLNVYNDIDAVIQLTDGNIFVLINEKQQIYINLAIVTGISDNGAVQTKVNLNQNITADKEGMQMLKTFFNKY